MGMPNFNPTAFLSQMLNQNPQLQSNPQAQELKRLVQTGDVNGVQEMGQNICNSLGKSPEEMLQQGMQAFGIPKLF